jgi:hypothetical protein
MRPAIADVGLIGPVEPGDDVVVNVEARELGLGSGGFDVVHVNLTRGLDAAMDGEAHVMKLNYTSLQHSVTPVESAEEPEVPLGRPVGVIALHGQLPCVAWSYRQVARDGARLGYVQTAGGALPGRLSNVVADLLDRGLLAGHITAGPAFGGADEAITTAGAIDAAFAVKSWDAVVAGPGPGILGSATALGHGGLAAMNTAHAALALGCRTVIVPRMSSGDPRDRHRGLSHHTRTVLELLLQPAVVALPDGQEPDLPGEHEARVGEADLGGYRDSGLPASTMGRGAEEDELFFRAALAGGSVLAEETQWND